MRELFTAKNFDKLQRKLEMLNADVHWHPKNRTNDDVQNYSLVSLLSSIALDTSCFPLTVFARERPDFLVVCSTSEIGIEHTEAIHVNQAKERALRADGHGPEIYSPIKFRIGDPALSSDEILRLILADRGGDGWFGDEVERSWAEAFKHFIEKKARSSNKPGYTRYPDNRLLIYDNWTAPQLNHMQAIDYLQSSLDHELVWSSFNGVYIVDETSTIEVTSGGSRIQRSTRLAI